MAGEPNFTCGGKDRNEKPSLPNECPKCGTQTGHGYGLAGGGIGPYVYCMGNNCDYFAKIPEETANGG